MLSHFRCNKDFLSGLYKIQRTSCSTFLANWVILALSSSLISKKKKKKVQIQQKQNKKTQRHLICAHGGPSSRQMPFGCLFRARSFIGNVHCWDWTHIWQRAFQKMRVESALSALSSQPRLSLVTRDVRAPPATFFFGPRSIFISLCQTASFSTAANPACKTRVPHHLTHGLFIFSSRAPSPV